MQSGNSQAAPSINHQDSALAAADTRGKHRITAELKRLEQESRFLEKIYGSTLPSGKKKNFKIILEELEQLEKTDRASTACMELLSIVESKPDPLLPITYGPANPLWDRWFEGPQDSQGCRCWIL